MFLYQQIKLTPLKKDKSNLPVRYISFGKEQNICNLSKAESFYFWTEIFKGKEVFSDIQLKYKIQYLSEQGQETGFTDGQFYQFNGKTIDIGYNFLIENKLEKRFRPKNEYEK